MAKKKTEGFEQLQNRVNELETQLKRAVADYHNLEKRVSEGRSELTNFVGAELIRKLIPTLDHMEQVVDQGRSTLSEQSESKGWFQGVELAVKEFKQVLQQEGLEQIPIESGFDPALHEAVDTKVGDDNKILEVVRVGYILNGKVLRPAQVVVGKKHPPTMEETKNIPGGETSNLTASEQSDFHIPPKGES